jgi:hypothetical protein
VGDVSLRGPNHLSYHHGKKLDWKALHCSGLCAASIPFLLYLTVLVPHGASAKKRNARRPLIYSSGLIADARL